MSTNKTTQRWTSEKVKELRLGLGWSQAELARRLGCKLAEVHAWENSDICPGPELVALLDRTFEDAQEFNHKMKLEPIAEAAMRALKSNQIDSDQIESLTPEIEIAKELKNK